MYISIQRIIPRVRRHASSQMESDFYENEMNIKKGVLEKAANELATADSLKNTADEDEPDLQFSIDMPDTEIRPGTCVISLMAQIFDPTPVFVRF